MTEAPLSRVLGPSRWVQEDLMRSLQRLKPDSHWKRPYKVVQKSVCLALRPRETLLMALITQRRELESKNILKPSSVSGSLQSKQEELKRRQLEVCGDYFILLTTVKLTK